MVDIIIYLTLINMEAREPRRLLLLMVKTSIYDSQTGRF